MFAQVARRAALSTRNFTSSAVRRGGDGLPAPGDNLPFSINNRSEIITCFTFTLRKPLADVYNKYVSH